MLVAFCEECARLTVEPHLSPGQQTVGTWVNLRHLAATPEGMQVTIRTELVKVEERRLHFRFEAWDELEKIGEGEHERFVIDVERFQRRVSEKASTSIRPSEH
jgi:predicted thioesterase